MKNDEAYENRAFILGSAEYPPRWAAEAAAFRDRLSAEGRAELDIPYGPGERQAVDLFRPEGAARGTLIFVHGGYWRAFSRKDWSAFAAGALARGWAVAMPGYVLAPGARVSDITRQVRAAVGMIAAREAGPLALAGHSAGGHLVARMLCADVGLPADVLARLRKTMPISPVADLRPLLETSMNADLRLDAAEAEAESPVLMAPAPVPVTVWVGSAERPAFLDQARGLAEAWGAALHIEPGRHHFDIIDGLADPASALLDDLLGQDAA